MSSMWMLLLMVLVSCVDAQSQQAGLEQGSVSGDFVDASPSVAQPAPTSQASVSETTPAALPDEDEDDSPAEDSADPAAKKSDISLLLSSVIDELILQCESRLRTSNAEIFERISSRLDALTSKLGTLEDAFISFRSNTEGRLASNEQSLNIVTAKQSRFKESLSDVKSGQIYLNSSLHDLTSSQRNLAKTVDASKSEYAAMGAAIKVLSAQQTSLNATLRDISAHQSSFNEEIAGVSSNVTSLQNSLRGHIIAQQEFQESVASNISRQTSHSELHDVLLPVSLQANVSYQIARNTSERTTVLEAVVRSLPRYLGSPCNNSTQCRHMVRDSLCSAEGACTCREGFRNVDGSISECRQIRLNDSCTQESQCLVNNANSVCQNNICACKEAYWARGNTCRARKRKGETCSYDGDCSLGQQIGSCSNGRCSCVGQFGGYEYRIGSSHCSSEGRSEGRVELRRRGRSWGYVCDDHWSAEDAKVFCRSLGFSGGTAVCCSKYGGSDNFHMDDVKCIGTEAHLMMCPHAGWGRDNCGGTEVAGVKCS